MTQSPTKRLVTEAALAAALANFEPGEGGGGGGGGTASSTDFTPAAGLTATNVQEALEEVASEKLTSVETLTAPPGSPLFRRTLNYTMDSGHPDMWQYAINGVTRSWANEWGAARFRPGAHTSYADAGTRFIVESGDFTGTTGGGGNAVEIVDRRRPEGTGRQRWGRRWEDGSLVRNGIAMADVWVRDSSATPVPSDLPPGTVVLTLA